MDTEDAPEAVVPLRPGFDIQVRGFNRSQVIEHIELLEDQLKMVTIDRNEAVQLNSDLRRLCEDTRHELLESQNRLKQIESSDTGLPHASQRVQNMLDIAEEEVQTLRDRAKRQAEIIRGNAETEARELVTEAENTATAFRTECAELVAELEARRDQLRRDHAKQIQELREREQRLRHLIRNEYKNAVAAAQEETDELLARTQRQCAQLDAETEHQRLNALEEINLERAELADLRRHVLSTLESARTVIGDSATALRDYATHRASPAEHQSGDGDGAVDGESDQALHVSDSHEDVLAGTITVPIERPTNGSSSSTGAPGTF